MIKILKHIIKEDTKADYVAQLDDIYNIQREIVQSSSGRLTETKFQDILKCIRKVLQHKHGKVHKLLGLHKITK